MLYNPATEAEAAARLFNAQRTGQPDALPTAATRPHTAAFFARNRAACDYANQLASDPRRLAIEAEAEAEADRNETGAHHYATR